MVQEGGKGPPGRAATIAFLSQRCAAGTPSVQLPAATLIFDQKTRVMAQFGTVWHSFLMLLKQYYDKYMQLHSPQ
jgi:hypothetical protein